MNSNLIYCLNETKIKIFGKERIAYKLMTNKEITEDDLSGIFKNSSEQGSLLDWTFKKLLKKVDKKMIEKELLKSKEIFAIIWYLFYSLKRRRPEAEDIIKQNDHWWNFYKRKFKIKS